MRNALTISLANLVLSSCTLFDSFLSALPDGRARVRCGEAVAEGCPQ